MTLEAVPPGQLATKINPKEKKGGKLNKIDKLQPKKGIIVNCKKNPINNHDGVFNILS